MKTNNSNVNRNLINLIIISCFAICFGSCSDNSVIHDTDITVNTDNGINTTLRTDSLPTTMNGDTIIDGIKTCDLNYVENYLGTACCVSGPIQADPGDTLTFNYYSNLGDSSLLVTWEVIDGAIRLIAGQNTNVATFVFGDDFTQGTIRGDGGSADRGCSEAIMLTRK
jgi:hypothetical protein